MSTTTVVPPIGAALTGNGTPSAQDRAVEAVVYAGDLSKLAPADRVKYYAAVCASLGLNPLTKPFGYLQMKAPGRGGTQLVLYAFKSCTDQLRARDRISVKVTDRMLLKEAGVYRVVAQARTPDGREDEDVGVVALEKPGGKWEKRRDGDGDFFKPDGTMKPLTGEELANALMKAETKAKRRVTLAICGLGHFRDETELPEDKSARTVDVEVVHTQEQLPAPEPEGPPAPRPEKPPVVTVIDGDQHDTIRRLITATGADPQKFCDEFKIEDTDHLPADCYGRAIQMLEDRRRKLGAAKQPQ
jgi:hypothetical protein